MSNFKEWLNLKEMSVKKFDLVGQWGPEAKKAYGYNKQDVGILENPKGQQKIIKKWSNSKEDFNLIFVRSSQANKHREVGEVNADWVKNNLGIDVQPDPDAITIIFTQNTGAEKIPMTAWTIAHRLGHAIRRDNVFEKYFFDELVRDFRELLRDVYKISDSRSSYEYPDQKSLLALAREVGTMKSAREGNLRNFFEFIYELVAQYITTGKIVFKDLPKSLILQKRFAWGNPIHTTAHHNLSDDDLLEFNYQLQNLADKYEHYLDSVFIGLVGKIFVM